MVERKNRQLIEVVRASLFDIKVPQEYWGEAARLAAYLINRTPSQVIGFKTPYQLLQELVSALTSSKLEPRVFDCTAYIHKVTGKLDRRFQKGVSVL